MSTAISAQNLVKRYGTLTALNRVSLTVEEGEVVAVVGPNGAGKTTMVEILEGYRAADEGKAEVLGHDPSTASRGFRDRIGIVLQETGIEHNLGVREAIEYYGAAYSQPLPADDLIKQVGLEAKAGSKIKTLSGGQRRRLDLALGLVGNPDLIFLDEPTTGFDPSARQKSWELVKGLTELGKTILLTTHYMEEAQHLADRVIIISNGQIVAEGTPDKVGGEQHITTVRFQVPDPSRLPQISVAPSFDREWVEYQTTEPTALLHTLTNWAVQENIELQGIEVSRPGLEDTYLNILSNQDSPDSPDEVSVGK